MKKKFSDLISHQNSLSRKSASPYSRHADAGRSTGNKRSSLNAFQHGLSGNHLIMQLHEFAAYEQLSKKMLRDLEPESEPENQIVQKIIDLNFRINRITAIENNLLNFDMGSNEPAWEQDEGMARMMGQARAWKQDAHSFEILGRYEARLSRQLLQYQKELQRMQTARRADVPSASQTTETMPLNPESASFGEPAPAYVMAAHFAPPAPAPPIIAQPVASTPLESTLASFGKPLPPPTRLLVRAAVLAPSNLPATVVT